MKKNIQYNKNSSKNLGKKLIENNLQSSNDNINDLKHKQLRLKNNVNNEFNSLIENLSNEINTDTLNSNNIINNFLQSTNINSTNIETDTLKSNFLDINSGTVQNVDDTDINSIPNINWVNQAIVEKGYFDPTVQINLTNTTDDASLTTLGNIIVGYNKNNTSQNKITLYGNNGNIDTKGNIKAPSYNLGSYKIIGKDDVNSKFYIQNIDSYIINNKEILYKEDDFVKLDNIDSINTLNINGGTIKGSSINVSGNIKGNSYNLGNIEIVKRNNEGITIENINDIQTTNLTAENITGNMLNVLNGNIKCNTIIGNTYKVGDTIIINKENDNILLKNINTINTEDITSNNLTSNSILSNHNIKGYSYNIGLNTIIYSNSNGNIIKDIYSINTNNIYSDNFYGNKLEITGNIKGNSLEISNNIKGYYYYLGEKEIIIKENDNVLIKNIDSINVNNITSNVINCEIINATENITGNSYYLNTTPIINKNNSKISINNIDTLNVSDNIKSNSYNVGENQIIKAENSQVNINVSGNIKGYSYNLGDTQIIVKENDDVKLKNIDLINTDNLTSTNINGTNLESTHIKGTVYNLGNDLIAYHSENGNVLENMYNISSLNVTGGSISGNSLNVSGNIKGNSYNLDNETVINKNNDKVNVSVSGNVKGNSYNVGETQIINASNNKVYLNNIETINSNSLEVLGDIKGNNYYLGNVIFAIKERNLSFETGYISLFNVSSINDDTIKFDNENNKIILRNVDVNSLNINYGYVNSIDETTPTSIVNMSKINSINERINDLESQITSMGISFIIKDKNGIVNYVPTEYINYDYIFVYNVTSDVYTLYEWNNNSYTIKSVPMGTTVIIKEYATFVKTNDDINVQLWYENTYDTSDTLNLTNPRSLITSGTIEAGGNVSVKNGNEQNILLDKNGNIQGKSYYIDNYNVIDNSNNIKGKSYTVEYGTTSSKVIDESLNVSGNYIYGNKYYISGNNTAIIDENKNINCNNITGNNIIGTFKTNSNKSFAINDTDDNTQLQNISLITTNNIKIGNKSIEEYIFDKLYPIDSLYLRTSEISGIKSSNGGHYYVSWMGCKWEFLYTSQVNNKDVKRYLTIGGQPSGSGSNWQIKDYYGTGGNFNHYHTTTNTSNLTTNGCQLTIDDLPEHDHTIPDHKHTIPNHNHTIPDHNHTGTADSDGSNHIHSWTAYNGNSTSGADHCDSVGVSSGNEKTHYTGKNGSHTHTLTINNKTGLVTNNKENFATNNIENLVTGKTGSSINAHKHNFSVPEINTTNTKNSNGEIIQDLPLYLLVYIYKRVE